jgi:hypothetical protein
MQEDIQNIIQTQYWPQTCSTALIRADIQNFHDRWPEIIQTKLHVHCHKSHTYRNSRYKCTHPHRQGLSPSEFSVDSKQTLNKINMPYNKTLFWRQNQACSSSLQCLAQKRETSCHNKSRSRWKETRKSVIGQEGVRWWDRKQGYHLEKSMEITWYMVEATRGTATDSEPKRSA